MSTKPACPNCKEEKNLSVERRPDGNASCGSCGWSGPYAECFEEKPEKQPREIRDRG